MLRGAVRALRDLCGVSEPWHGRRRRLSLGWHFCTTASSLPTVSPRMRVVRQLRDLVRVLLSIVHSILWIFHWIQRQAQVEGHSAIPQILVRQPRSLRSLRSLSHPLILFATLGRRSRTV